MLFFLSSLSQVNTTYCSSAVHSVDTKKSNLVGAEAREEGSG